MNLILSKLSYCSKSKFKASPTYCKHIKVSQNNSPKTATSTNIPNTTASAHPPPPSIATDLSNCLARDVSDPSLTNRRPKSNSEKSEINSPKTMSRSYGLDRATTTTRPRSSNTASYGATSYRSPGIDPSPTYTSSYTTSYSSPISNSQSITKNYSSQPRYISTTGHNTTSSYSSPNRVSYGLKSSYLSGSTSDLKSSSSGYDSGYVDRSLSKTISSRLNLSSSSTGGATSSYHQSISTSPINSSSYDRTAGQSSSLNDTIYSSTYRPSSRSRSLLPPIRKSISRDSILSPSGYTSPTISSSRYDIPTSGGATRIAGISDYGTSSASERSSGRTLTKGSAGTDLSSMTRTRSYSRDRASTTASRDLTGYDLNNNVSARRKSGTGGGSSGGGSGGLRNIGNSCYLNSVIQCILHCDPIKEYLTSGRFKSDINSRSKTRGKVAESSSSLFQSLLSGQTGNPGQLKSGVSTASGLFRGTAQEDAQEFLRWYLEALHEDVSRVTNKPRIRTEARSASEAWNQYTSREDSSIVDLCVGQLKSTLTCDHCRYVSEVWDPFWDLSLPIPSRARDVSDCMSEFEREEVLDGNERPKCEKCNARRRMRKKFSIEKCPQVLVLHLKRFGDSHGYSRSKISTNISFPHRLNLKGSYTLKAVCNHSGGVGGGHYIAYGKTSSGWFEYNDSIVSSLSESSVQSRDAYLLFYTR